MKASLRSINSIKYLINKASNVRAFFFSPTKRAHTSIKVYPNQSASAMMKVWVTRKHILETHFSFNSEE